MSVSGALSHTYEVEPGEVIRGKIQVNNDKNVVGRAKISVNDYLTQAKGVTDFPAPGTSKRSLSPWLELSTDQYLDVKPNGNAFLNYTIRVPKDESLCGSYWIMVFVEPSTTDPAPPMTKGVGIKTLFRYGVQLIVNIGKTGEADLRVIDRYTKEVDGKKLLCVDVENVGERFCRTESQLELFMPNSSEQVKIGAGARRIYPGCQATYSFEISEVKKGNYQSLLVFDSEEDDVFAATSELSIE
ncbi:MAG: hypothetical protein MRY21_02875 [Simkaniaceae bacterium]|nr:hypothetical protein [Simkaniaceae bacterium]